MSPAGWPLLVCFCKPNMWLSLLVSLRKCLNMGHKDRYNRVMIPESGEKDHGEDQAISTGDIYGAVLHRDTVPRISGQPVVNTGYICSRCSYRHEYRLANARYQCVECRHHVSVTEGTVLHTTHMPLTQWFLAFYFIICQDNRGISAVQLVVMIRTTYKTAWFMLRHIRTAMG